MNWNYFYDHYDEWSEDKQRRAISELKDFGSSFEVSETALYAPDEDAARDLLYRASKAGVVFNSEDICKVDCSVEEEMLDYLVGAALRAGKAFSAGQIGELTGLISEDVLSDMVAVSLSKGEHFSEDQIIELSGLIKTDVLNRLVAQPGLNFTDNQKETLASCCDWSLQCEGYVEETGVNMPDPPKKASLISNQPDNSRKKREKKPGKLFGALAFGGMLIDSEKKKPTKFRVGDRVRIRYRGQEGTIIDINGSLYTVSVDGGRHVDSYYENQLDRAW